MQPGHHILLLLLVSRAASLANICLSVLVEKTVIHSKLQHLYSQLHAEAMPKYAESQPRYPEFFARQQGRKITPYCKDCRTLIQAFFFRY